jgi:hypothetical protein
LAISYSTRFETGCPDSIFRGECSWNVGAWRQPAFH